MVCADTTLDSVYQGSLQHGPRAKSDLRNHFTRPRKIHFVGINEKIIYLQKTC